jgi:ankyrin repeat protein
MVRTFLMYRTNIYMTTAIEAAIDRDHVDMVLLLASNEADSGDVLRIAARKGNEKMARVLLANHVKIDSKNDLGYTALMTASEFGHSNVVNLLLAHPDASITIDQTDPLGQTALMKASRTNQLNALRALLTAGANINRQDSGGFTSLMEATRFAHFEIVRELLIWNACTESENARFETALDLADDQNLVSLIEEHIKERESYDKLKKEMESFFSGKVKLSETKSILFLPRALVNIIDKYACPTVEDKPAKK